jgi:hypothetical protein
MEILMTPETAALTGTGFAVGKAMIHAGIAL